MNKTQRKALKLTARKKLNRQGRQMYCVFSLRDKKEHKSPWFTSLETAQKAKALIMRKGYEAIIYQA